MGSEMNVTGRCANGHEIVVMWNPDLLNVIAKHCPTCGIYTVIDMESTGTEIVSITREATNAD